MIKFWSKIFFLQIWFKTNTRFYQLKYYIRQLYLELRTNDIFQKIFSQVENLNKHPLSSFYDPRKPSNTSLIWKWLIEAIQLYSHLFGLPFYPLSVLAVLSIKSQKHSFIHFSKLLKYRYIHIFESWNLFEFVLAP